MREKLDVYSRAHMSMAVGLFNPMKELIDKQQAWVYRKPLYYRLYFQTGRNFSAWRIIDKDQPGKVEFPGRNTKEISYGQAHPKIYSSQNLIKTGCSRDPPKQTGRHSLDSRTFLIAVSSLVAI